MEIREDWEPSIQAMHRQNQDNVRQALVAEYGPVNFEQKLTNYIDFGDLPFCIVAFHNEFFRQVRSAFVTEAYYPSLTGACALGERILNHLILTLRDEFKARPEYKRVYKKGSFDNWDVVVDTLESWGVLMAPVATAFRKLASIRNQSLHFEAGLEMRVRDTALQAIGTLREIVSHQFSALGPQPWFIASTPGASFIKRTYESDPFVKHVYIPRCAYVGPLHSIEFAGIRMGVTDDHAYPPGDISDEQYAMCFQARSLEPLNGT